MLSPALTERVLTELGLGSRPDVDLAGLGTLFAAVCDSVANDNIQKRIWFASDRSAPVTGGDPIQFWEKWLEHGTGGTCFPLNGGFAALLEGLGFPARRITSSMMVPGAERGVSNHGTVLVHFDGVDYLADAQLGSREVLPLVPREASETSPGIHAIRALPIEDGHEILFWPGHTRDREFRCQTEPEHDPVDQPRFRALYQRSALEPGFSPFNTALCASRHFESSIVSIHRGKRIDVSTDGTVTTEDITFEDARHVLIEELGVSEEAATALPEDEPEGPVVADR